LPADTEERLRIAPGPCLPGRLDAGALATGAVGCVGLAARLDSSETVIVDPARVAASFRADQLQLVS
jgi:hypothetical protein